jgi:hypothetical protein
METDEDEVAYQARRSFYKRKTLTRSRKNNDQPRQKSLKEKHKVNVLFWKRLARFLGIGMCDPQFLVYMVMVNVCWFYYEWGIVVYITTLGGAIHTDTLAFLKDFNTGTEAYTVCNGSAPLLHKLADISRKNIWGDKYEGACAACGSGGTAIPAGYDGQWKCLGKFWNGNVTIPLVPKGKFKYWDAKPIRGDFSDQLGVHAGLVYFFAFWALMLVMLSVFVRFLGSLMVARLRVVLTQKIHCKVFSNENRVLYNMIVLERSAGLDNYDQRLCQDLQTLLDNSCAILFGKLDMFAMVGSIWGAFFGIRQAVNGILEVQPAILPQFIASASGVVLLTMLSYIGPINYISKLQYNADIYEVSSCAAFTQLVC